jgi:hypothetical protein
MKKLFFYLAFLASGNCFAATGNASDGELAILSVITLLMLPLAIVYFIHFLRNRIDDFRIKRMISRQGTGHNGEM